ncbi:hypothetical protein [Pelotalea chapellei]|uniref:Uncharacterized protein n=1 Tax=Pelotalea chapellei TaxID=44671 RepID=A0ABS5UBC2_9BACT|nr:hypothetical protein [Pelotalea chapellei]MBT1072951.1 hypothetical protein [Pelotalea chapellei]
MILMPAIKRTISALSLLLLASASADAFVFDVWKSGMKTDRVIEAGKKKGVAVKLDSGGLFSKKEPEDLAVKVEYHCNTKLMGYDAKILFSFAPLSRVLHTLRVTVKLPMSSEKADMDVLADSIARQLDVKYKEQGEPAAESMIGGMVDKMRDVKRRSWKSGSDTVTMESQWKMVGGEVAVLYVDDKLAEKAGVEDRQVREKKLERSSGSDRSKF